VGDMLTPALIRNGTTHIRALFDGPKFKVGDQVTLKGDDARWDVVEVQPLHSGCFYNRGWNNNI
jgi:hypothetical protein